MKRVLRYGLITVISCLVLVGSIKIIKVFLGAETAPIKISIKPFNEIEKSLHQLAPNLNPKIIDIVIQTLKCANKDNVDHNHLLTLIDYSLPANEKRLWVFDLAENRLLFHTYVAHGIQSGTLSTHYFSNKFNGKASSMGIFTTDKAYRGRHGESLKLYGLDKDFNDNAYNRFIVMHGAWYVEDWFIKKYGRTGRSWGCPVLPRTEAKAIIDIIKDKTLLVVYYPSQEWLMKSKFLHCELAENTITIDPNVTPSIAPEAFQRDPILFIDINHNGKREENEPILVIDADFYKKIFNKEVPLDRMLRRQINNGEYIAINKEEFNQIYQNNSDSIYFIIPVVKMQRGYYVTEMQMVNLGKIHKVINDSIGNYIIYFDNKPSAEIKSDDRFIRWLGL